jgi:hypothetical protein
MLSSAGLWRVNTATGHRHKLIKDDTAASRVWSPDGTSIAYLSTKDYDGSLPAGEDTNKTNPSPEVYTTSPTGTRTHRLATSEDAESHLLWSTDSHTPPLPTRQPLHLRRHPHPHPPLLSYRRQERLSSRCPTTFKSLI